MAASCSRGFDESVTFSITISGWELAHPLIFSAVKHFGERCAILGDSAVQSGHIATKECDKLTMEIKRSPWDNNSTVEGKFHHEFVL